MVRSWASAEQCEAALGQARTALGEARVEDARTALGQAAAVCPADRNTELASLALEVQQAQASMLCARIEVEATTLLNQARPQQARSLLNEHEARCAARGEYRGLASRVDTRIRAAERALAEARMNLTQGALDAAADALQRAKRSDADVIGATAVESALVQARAAALQPPPSAQMPSPARADTAPLAPIPARQMPPPLPQAPIASPPPPNAQSEVQRQVAALLRDGEVDLARHNYRGAITKAETALLLAPGNRAAGDLKRRAAAAEQEALRDIQVQ